MAKPLEAITIAAPGFYGLNTQESGITLQPNFATVATNCVIDKYGRLGARKGWEYITTTGGTASNLLGGHSFVDIDGTHTFITWNASTFYKATTTTDPNDTLTAITDNSTVFASNNFQAATLNDKAFFVTSGQEPRYFDPTLNAGAGGVEDLSTAGATVTPQQANTCLSAYGRLWIADTPTDKTTIWWSDLLNGTNFDTGTSGSLDLSAILVNGNDEIVAIGAHVGRLIIFCKNNIVIYGDTDGDTALDPATMKLVEVINGVGCVARDSVQNTGSDIIFLANDGVRSLGRLLQEKSQPMRDLSKNIRDDLQEAVAGETGNIRSSYNPKLAAYLLLLPEYGRVYCMDLRNYLEDNSSRITTWDAIVHSSLLSIDDELYYFYTDGIAKYTGYMDNGSSYGLKYYTTFVDFGDSTRQKYLKRIAITIIGGATQDVVFKSTGSYSQSYNSYIQSINPGSIAEYGVAEYNETWEYSTGILAETLRIPTSGNGDVLQVGFEADINGAPFSIQRLSMYAKLGRTY